MEAQFTTLEALIQSQSIANVLCGESMMIGTNYRRWFAVSLIAALCSLVGLSSVGAQTPPDPIILNIEGDLWAWDGADQPMTQLTDWGMNEEPILSPDGT